MKVMLSLATSAQQETEAFKRWFGKSKVVDKDGKALRVFHGTKGDFKEFDPKLIGNGNNENGVGFYFTTNTVWTGLYSGGEGGNTIPVYLKIQKPIYYNRQPKATANMVAKLTFGAGVKILNTYLRDNYDVERTGIEAAKREYRETYIDMDLVAASFSIYAELYEGNPKQHVFAEIFKDATGYDGIIIPRGPDTNYVVFTPTQIKSAVGNAGTFKPRTADISK